MSPSALVSILPDPVDEAPTATAPTGTAMTPQQTPPRDAAPSLPGVLVLLPEGELRRRCLAVLTDAVLAEPTARVWQSWSDVPGDASLDVIITSPDGPQASDHGASAEADVPTHVGVILIGGAGPADVVLPETYLSRELEVACRLLGEVARLRRQLQEGSQIDRRLRAQALCDSLTLLPNRRAWDEELAVRLAAARSSGQPLCLAVVDLDHFKQVNDGWGYAAGDQLLVATAAALRQSLRQEDFVARLGGDEFGLLLSGLDAEASAGVIERVRVGLPARIARMTPHVTGISIGYAHYSGAAEQETAPCTAADLARAADEARRRAKRQGRNRTSAAPPVTRA